MKQINMWILTSEYNDYDQHGEYFEAVWLIKPTISQIMAATEMDSEYSEHILQGGGRVEYEYKWYNLINYIPPK